MDQLDGTAARGRLARLAGAVVLTIAAAACSGDPSGPAVPSNEVRVQNNSFSPAARTVAAGTTLTWRWAAGSAVHNVTFNDGPASPNQSSGTFARTFANAGVFAYQCTIHAGMNGTVTVQ